MTNQETIALWRKGARESLRLAEFAHSEGMYALALFHFHFAVEKALKALYMEEKNEQPPPMHELLPLAEKLSHEWLEDEMFLFDSLTTFAVRARYHDAEWAEKQATKENAEYWLEKTKALFAKLFP